MLQINVPTLVLWGMKDMALPPGLVEGLDAYVPRLTLERIKDGSHWLVHEQPALLCERMGLWLASSVAD